MSALPIPANPAAKAESWQARLRLGFSGVGGRTRVVQREHLGPLRIQRPFYPEDDGTCHVYLLHPPGGVVGGDQLRLEVSAENQSHVLITTPAATKLYRSAGSVAHLRQELRGSGESLIEWLPQETIAFEGTEVTLETVAELDGTSEFVGWEVICLGRPAAGEKFERGNIRQRFEVWREGTPLYLDRGYFGEKGVAHRAAWGLDGAPVLGTMVLASRRPDILSVARQSLAASHLGSKLDPSRDHIAATELDGITLVRYVGPSVPACWAAFVAIWRATRPLVSSKGATAPRIWNY
jgi:urease accessory protein